MKTCRTILSILGLTLVGALGVSEPALSTVFTSRAPTAPQTEQSHKAFREAFRKAQALNASAEMQKLVKKNIPEAVSLVMETAEALSTNPNEEVADRMIALRKAWRSAIDSDFAENMEVFFSLMDPQQKRERQALKARYEKAKAKYWKNQEKKAAQVYGITAMELKGVAEQLALIGDHYFAAQAWILRSHCWSEANRGEAADLYKVCESFKHAVASLEQIDLRVGSYAATKAAYESLAGQGFDRSLGGGEGGGDEPGGEGGGGPAAGGAKKGPSITASLSFEMVDDLHAYQRPCYYVDSLYNMWPQLGFRKKGSKVKFPSLGELSPDAIREGASIVGIDTNGDGKGEAHVELTGNLEPLLFKVGKGAEEREWGILTQVGTQADVFQGIALNMTPDSNQMSIYLAPGASMVGMLGETAVRVFDDNMDGIYGSDPISLGEPGLTKGYYQPNLDSVVLGKSKRAVPFSEYMKIGDKWYQLEALDFGRELKATEVELKTGTLKLSFKGPKPAWVIMRGVGRYEDSYFDITKGAEVPVGRYSLFYGEVRKGKKQEVAKTLILPGKSNKEYAVLEGKSTTVKLGGPFNFDFSFEEDETTIKLIGKSVVVIGALGERYERPWYCRAKPGVSWRKKGTKKGSKPAKTKLVNDNDQISVHGWLAAWHPLDVVLTKKGHVEASEVQLTMKKHKLFGKINSEWRGN